MHCDDAPCMKAATGGAIYKRSDGIVIIDPVKSVGQQQLVAACPYGAIYWNETLNIPQKCTMCAHLLDAAKASPPADPGLTVPRCVDVCPTGALGWGDDSDPAIQAKMAQGEVLHPEYGTLPRVYYLHLPKMFVAGAIYDEVADECLEGATVTATDLLSGTVYTTTTDNYGDFWLEDLPGGKAYELNVTLAGYLPKVMVVYLNKDVNVGDFPLFKEGLV
jgi:ferredoxin